VQEVKLQMASPIAEPTARKISPIFFLLAALCFLLPFAGVSCNTDKAKTLASASLGSNPALSAFAGGGLNGCIDGFKGTSLANYSGLNFAAGSAPSVPSNLPVPDACKQLVATACQAAGAAGGQAAVDACTAQASAGLTSSTPTSGDNAKLGVQIFAVLALIVILVGLVVGFLAIPGRGLITAAMGALAIVLLVVNYVVSGHALADKINASSQDQQTAQFLQGSKISDLLSLSFGIGLILCVLVLLIATVYNLASQFAGGRTEAVAAATPGGYVPSPTYAAGPPAGYGPGPTAPGGYGAPPPYQPPAPQPMPPSAPPPGGYGPPPGPPQGPPPGP
jgi:hypothetical protein